MSKGKPWRTCVNAPTSSHSTAQPGLGYAHLSGRTEHTEAHSTCALLPAASSHNIDNTQLVFG